MIWPDHHEQRCFLFGGGHRALDYAREQSAILPAGSERDRAYEEYLRARKFLWNAMIGRVVCGEGDKDTEDIWVVGGEETSTIDFEIMLSKAKPGRQRA